MFALCLGLELQLALASFCRLTLGSCHRPHSVFNSPATTLNLLAMFLMIKLLGINPSPCLSLGISVHSVSPENPDSQAFLRHNYWSYLSMLSIRDTWECLTVNRRNPGWKYFSLLWACTAHGTSRQHCSRGSTLAPWPLFHLTQNSDLLM